MGTFFCFLLEKMLCEIRKGLLPIAFVAGIFKNDKFWLAMVLKKMFQYQRRKTTITKKEKGHVQEFEESGIRGVLP